MYIFTMQYYNVCLYCPVSVKMFIKALQKLKYAKLV